MSAGNRSEGYDGGEGQPDRDLKTAIATAIANSKLLLAAVNENVAVFE